MRAFIGPTGLLVEGEPSGPLAGTTLAVKDVIDVAGRVTGAGNPDLAASRAPAGRSAPVVEALVAAGATVVGKTVTDELAYSLGGDNEHFPPPVNPAAPDRTTGGSIRVPASYCGILGWRPTHGAVSAEGVTPLASSFDTIGLFARSAPLLRAAAGVALATVAGRPVSPSPVERFAIVAELMDLIGPPGTDARDALEGAVLDRFGAAVPTIRLGCDMDECLATFRTLQGAEAWATHGGWIRSSRPRMGENTAYRFDAASKVTAEQVAAARPVRERVRRAVLDATAGGTVLLAPAAAGPAPVRGEYGPEAERIRADTLRSTVIGSLAGVPVVVVPTWGVPVGSRHLPLGLALMGAPGTDLALLDLIL